MYNNHLQHRDIGEFLDAEVYPYLDRALVFEDLEPVDKGAYYLARCPSCGKREAFIYKSGFSLQCNRRGNCGHSVSLIAHICGGEAPRGGEFVEAARRLAGLAGVHFPERELTEEEIRRVNERERKGNLLEAFIGLTRSLLTTPNASTALDYLTKTRGLQAERLDAFEFGFYPTQQAVKAALIEQGFSLDEIEASRVIYDGRWEHRLIAPWRDRSGRITNVWARDLTSHSESSEKYLMLSGGSKAAPYGLHSVRGHEVVLVEGFLDAISAQANGVTNVAALGGSAISDDQIAALEAARVKSVTLNLDCDEAGIKATAAAVDKLARAPFEVFVVDPLLMADSQDPAAKVDPDAFIRANGVETYQALLHGAVHAFRYKARSIADKYMSGVEWTDSQKLAALDEAIGFDASITDPVKLTALSTCFWPEILELTGADWEAVNARIAGVRRKLEEDREHKAYQALLSEAGRALEGGELDRAKALLRNRVDILRSEERIGSSEPVASVSEELAIHEERLQRWRGSDFLGLPQQSIPTLDESTLGLRGLMLLAAAPNVGKTALAVQLGLDIVRCNPDACFLFLSLEMSRWDILSRMKCSLAEMDWKTLVFGSQSNRGRGQAVMFDDYEQGRLVEASAKLAEWGSRIRILDERNFPNPTVEKVIQQLEDLKARSGSKRAFLLVDYLQVWPIPEHETAGIRSELDADKWRIGAMKTLRDASEDGAVMVISEARKPSGSSRDSWGGDLSDVMGSARGSYTPDMVFLFRPFNDEELIDSLGWDKTGLDQGKRLLQDAGKSYNKLIIAKGRDGVLRRSIDLTFLFRQSRFEEGLS